jgi:hypothetical protein
LDVQISNLLKSHHDFPILHQIYIFYPIFSPCYTIFTHEKTHFLPDVAPRCACPNTCDAWSWAAPQGVPGSTQIQAYGRGAPRGSKKNIFDGEFM